AFLAQRNPHPPARAHLQADVDLALTVPRDDHQVVAHLPHHVVVRRQNLRLVAPQPPTHPKQGDQLPPGPLLVAPHLLRNLAGLTHDQIVQRLPARQRTDTLCRYVHFTLQPLALDEFTDGSPEPRTFIINEPLWFLK